MQAAAAAGAGFHKTRANQIRQKNKVFSSPLKPRRSFSVYKVKEEEDQKKRSTIESNKKRQSTFDSSNKSKRSTVESNKKSRSTSDSSNKSKRSTVESPKTQSQNTSYDGSKHSCELQDQFGGFGKDSRMGRCSITINAAKKEKKNIRLTTIYITTICATVGGFMFGYETAVMNGAIIIMESDMTLTHVWKETLRLITPVAAGGFCIVAGMLSDRFGRRRSIMSSALIVMIGAIIAAISQDLLSICFGRAIVGFGLGVVTSVVPVYVSECAPKDYRGFLVTIFHLMITIGILMAGIMAGSIQEMYQGWRVLLGITAVPAIVQYIYLFALPESPRYLVMIGEVNQALGTLTLLSRDEDKAKEELAEIQSSLYWDADIKTGVKAWRLVFKTHHVRKALIMGCLLQFFQQMSGISAVRYFSATIMKSVGFDLTNHIWLATIPSIFSFFGTFLALWAVEKVGRKRIFAYSFFAVAFSCCILSAGFRIAAWNSPLTSNGHDYGSSGDCAEFIYCDTCLRLSDTKCAYCAPDTNLWMNGSCVEIGSGRTHHEVFAKKGRCNNNSTVYTSMKLMYEFCPSSYGVVQLIGLILFMASFASGAGPMPWTINSEIFPLWARSMCYSLTVFIYWLFDILVSLAFSNLRKGIRGYGFFLVFLLMSIVAGIYVTKLIPETKGQSLEIIEYAFMKEERKNEFMDAMVIKRLQSKTFPNVPRCESSEGSQETEVGCVDDVRELRRLRKMKGRCESSEGSQETDMGCVDDVRELRRLRKMKGIE